MIRLTIQRAGAAPESFASARDDVLIGSSASSDVRLPGDPAAPYALLYSSANGLRLRDLGTVSVEHRRSSGSAEGVFSPGDTLVIAGTVITLDDGSAQAPAAPRRKPPPPPVDADSAALLMGMPVGTGFSGGAAEAFRPHLEVFEAGATSARKLMLGKEPILFGSDPGCHVRITGLGVPAFVAAIETLHERVSARKISGGLLGPKVTLDGEPLKQETALNDGARLFVGDVTVFVRLKRR